MKIAVIGSGISGNAAAWCLNTKHDVTLYEKRLRPGGHSATVDIDYDGTKIAVDTGFIVFNPSNYPNLTALFEHLGVPTERSNMSFAVSRKNGTEWSGQLPKGIFAQKRNLVSPSFLWMLREIFRFNKTSIADLHAGALCGLSLGQYLENRRFSERFQTDYLVPMGAAIWSTPAAEMLRFPAESFVNFFNNHRLLHFERPKWKTVSGGSRVYVERLLEPLKDKIRLGCEVTSVERVSDGVIVHDSFSRSEKFDQVIFGSHSDQTLRMLSDPSNAEREILSAVEYRPNTVYLHRDEALMPKLKSAWAAWNYICDTRRGHGEPGDNISVSYWMNRLQNLDPTKPLFVSLNPSAAPASDKTFAVFEYDHPQFDAKALDAQERLDEIQGTDRIWYCGAWTGHGFHEDGLRSGLKVAERLGAVPPWREKVTQEEPLLLEAAE